MSIPTISNSTTAPDSRSTVRTSSGQTSAAGAGASSRAPAQQGGTPQTSVDAVSISTQAVDLQSLEASIRQLPEVNVARVVELRDQINANQYQVDSQRVADKILAFEQKL